LIFPLTTNGFDSGIRSTTELVMTLELKSGRRKASPRCTKGLFLLDRSGTLWQSQLVDASPGYANLVKEYSLPVSERTHLLNLLMKLGIDRAHLMPFFDGVLKEVEARRERQKRDRIPRVGESA
jgi:hypothetical protein